MTRHTDNDNVELETALQELALDLGSDAVETDMALGEDGGRGHGRHFVGQVLIGTRKGGEFDGEKISKLAMN